MRGVVVFLVVTLTACASSPQEMAAPTTVATTTTTTTTLAPPPAPPPAETVDVRGCASAQPRPWSILCRAHDLVIEHHVDRPESASLAAAAVAGVRQVESADAANRMPTESRIECVIPDGAYQSLCEAIVDRHRLDGIPVDTLVESAVQGMFRSGLDPFSAYLAPDYADRIDALGSGQVASLGLIVGARDGTGRACGPISEQCQLSVLAVFDFSPSATEGVLVGDTVIDIDGSPTAGLSEAEAVAALHAPAGIPTRITVLRSTGPVEKVLVHEDIPSSRVEFAMASPQIAYLRINDFSQEAAQAVGEVLSLPEMATATGLVLDLRDNPGGLVLSARAVASQFVHSGIVLVEQTRHQTVEVPVISGGLASPELEIVVLVNAGTASAAEIVAAALQGHGRAQVIGHRTFGKNLVQDVFEAPGGGEYRITTARWLGPGGIDVGLGGLVPDVVLGADATSDLELETAFGLLGS